MAILNLDTDGLTYYVKIDSNVNGYSNDATYMWELVDDGSIGTLVMDSTTITTSSLIVRGIDLFNVDTHIFTVKLTVTEGVCSEVITLPINVTDEVAQIIVLLTPPIVVPNTCTGDLQSVNGECVSVEEFLDSLILMKVYLNGYVPSVCQGICKAPKGNIKEETGGNYFKENNNRLYAWVPYAVVNGLPVPLDVVQAKLVRRKIHIDKYGPAWYKNTNFTVGEKASPEKGPECGAVTASSWENFGCGKSWGTPAEGRINNTFTNIDTGKQGTAKAQPHYTNYTVLFQKKVAATYGYWDSPKMTNGVTGIGCKKNSDGWSYPDFCLPCEVNVIASTGGGWCRIHGGDDVVQFRLDGNVKYNIATTAPYNSSVESEFVYKGSNGPIKFSAITDKTKIGYTTAGTSVTTPYRCFEVLASNEKPTTNDYISATNPPYTILPSNIVNPPVIKIINLNHSKALVIKTKVGTKVVSPPVIVVVSGGGTGGVVLGGGISSGGISSGGASG